MKILVAGDYCPQNRVAETISKNDFQQVLGEVKNIISELDYAIVNFECPVTYGKEKPIDKYGPNLNCSEKGIEAAKWAGFTCVTLANNHFYDYGSEGVLNTLSVCKKFEIDTVGGGMNLQEASNILYKEINGKKLAIINCCEHEFSIATEISAGSNPLNPINQYYLIRDARENADYVIVIVHGGHEYFQLPSPRMQETYRFFVDAGADAIINHHQHCYSGYEIYKEKPIFYGLGNFCFDKNKDEVSPWNYGYMVILEFGDKVKFKLIPYLQCAKYPTVSILNMNEINEDLIKLNDIIGNQTILQSSYERYLEASLNSCRFVLEPTNNKYIRELQNMGVFPSFLTKKWLLRLQNFIFCEAHLDKFRYFLANNKHVLVKQD